MPPSPISHIPSVAGSGTGLTSIASRKTPPLKAPTVLSKRSVAVLPLATKLPAKINQSRFVKLEVLWVKLVDSKVEAPLVTLTVAEAVVVTCGLLPYAKRTW